MNFLKIRKLLLGLLATTTSLGLFLASLPFQD
jgi:hypothetical protein